MITSIRAVTRAQFASLVLAMLAVVPQSSGAESFSLADAASIAIVENRDLRVAKLNIKKAEAQLTQAGLWPNPELEFSRNSDRSFNNEGEYSGEAGFKQRFPISGRLTHAKNVARVDVAMAVAEIRNEERLLIGEVTGALRELMVVDEKLAANRQLQSSVQELIKVSEKRLKVAEASPADINLEKLELQKLLLAQVSLQSQREALKELLNRKLGLQAGSDTSSKEPPTANVNLADLRQAKVAAVKNRPDWQLAALQIDRAASEVRLAKAERWEDWSVGFDYSRDKSSYDTALIPSSRDDFIGFSVSIPLPLWNQNQGKIADAQISKTQAIARVQALELQIETEAGGALLQVEGIFSHLSEYQARSLRLAEDNVRLLKDSYSQGLVGISAVIQAQQQLADIKQGYADLLGEFLKALTNFETVTASSPFWEKSL